MDWSTIGAFMSSVGIPVLVAVMAYREKKSEKRQAAQTQYNILMLDGQERIGSLSAANAKAVLNFQTEGSREELENELNEYEKFRKEVNDFKTKQTVGTLK